MSRVRELAGGGRAVEVAPARVAGWFERFARNHEGAATTLLEPRKVLVTAVDGATAAVRVPFGELPPPHGERSGLAVSSLVEHVSASRRIGLVLVRLGAHSVGVAVDGVVESSSTDRHLVHGRNKAGGWSQQRFARRREGQSARSLASAADAVARTLLPVAGELDGLVLGGDRQALQALREDNRLTRLFDRAEERVLDVPEPRRAVLDEAAGRAIAVEIEIRDPR
ncbi:acVLRF1 family peptidyl-tRNA hydrolase [Saccharopolyspora mangrovi]|uniref:AcVLRF1 family peptidyl-tRNA hydrolase n=1 Tax=Saccharopolyspora mangrovi TaxID=3082379 RepID=A0ABU6A6M7_9PSEU|nr:acVLRF1 family peptidyl-tRNA hydrolase [Saccharopolyspora sp. S2-29]MEB3367113.1 acVLRF1 family peptidyl-tRNA hydrolase [Saccharopolyspora sp. S2-29]